MPSKWEPLTGEPIHDIVNQPAHRNRNGTAKLIRIMVWITVIKPRRGVVSIRLFENDAVCLCRPSVCPRTISSEPTERISTKLGMQDVHDPMMVLGQN